MLVDFFDFCGHHLDEVRLHLVQSYQLSVSELRDLLFGHPLRVIPTLLINVFFHLIEYDFEVFLGNIVL